MLLCSKGKPIRWEKPKTTNSNTDLACGLLSCPEHCDWSVHNNYWPVRIKSKCSRFIDFNIKTAIIILHHTMHQPSIHMVSFKVNFIKLTSLFKCYPLAFTQSVSFLQAKGQSAYSQTKLLYCYVPQPVLQQLGWSFKLFRNAYDLPDLHVALHPAISSSRTLLKAWNLRSWLKFKLFIDWPQEQGIQGCHRKSWLLLHMWCLLYRDQSQWFWCGHQSQGEDFQAVTKKRTEWVED